MSSRDWLVRHQLGVYAVAVLIAVGLGLARPGLDATFETLIEPVVMVLLYVTFLEVPFVRLRAAFTDRRFMAAALGMNFLVVPVVVWLLTRPLSVGPVVLVGVFMVLLTPCIDYVIAFTDLAEGLFMRGQVAGVIDPGPFVEAFVLLIATPLALAWLTEFWAERSDRGERWQDAMGWPPGW